ncbi:hypothetical protein BEWA_029150 [Theileria equi strain WA]|uniref:Signal peptide containing protein n=1 Tax=Theileria equi strain WA TaxID=1537102 RepID=L0AWY1_THEEQ|nr:hypothetical protein BEWA_029150 [Theileria equi strain WA]AFZ80065.1 hypothetical protein BEWA_029150 [Theileria equi strain WA]|eukprot:XP_004829731.1 hypothetical protein BEWA_029150 [Theileria equi strain WA]
MKIVYTLLAILIIKWARCGDSDGKGVVKGAEQQNPPGPTHSASSLTSKADASLFNVEDGEDNGFKILKLTAKEGVTAKSITYGKETVWEDKKKSCSSAVLYMDGEKPTLAVLVTRDKNNKQGTVYRYHDGKKWKNGKEKDYKKKLSELKKKVPKTHSTTESQQNTQAAQPTESKEASTEAHKDDNTTSDNTDTQSAEQAQGPLQTDGPTPQGVTNEASTGYNAAARPRDDSSSDFEIRYKVPNNSSGTPANTTDPASAKSNGGSTTATLDLGNPDISVCEVFNVRIKGIPARAYLVTHEVGANVVRQIMSNGKDVWIGRDTKPCLYCIAFLKDDKPNMIATSVKSGSIICQTLREYDDKEGWQLSLKDNDKKMNALKTVQGDITKFSLDISLAESNENCVVENYEDNSLKTRLYAPKNGKAINKITDSEKVIGTLNDSYTCYLCELYSKSNIRLLRVHTETDYDVYLCHYMNDGSGWKMIKEDEFGTKLGELRNSTIQPASAESKNANTQGPVTPPSK